MSWSEDIIFVHCLVDHKTRVEIVIIFLLHLYEILLHEKMAPGRPVPSCSKHGYLNKLVKRSTC